MAGSSNQQQRVAIVGAGSMARAHALAFRGAGAEIVGLASRTKAKAEALSKELGVEAVVDSPESLATELDPDVIVVAVSVLSIPDVVTSLLGSRALLLIEKPAGHDLASAEALADAVDQTRSRAHVALNRRFLASTRWAMDQLPDGPRTVWVQDQQSRQRAREVGHPEEVVRNWHFANSIHLVDLIRTFARGTAVKVTRLQRPGANGGVLVAGIEFDSGDFGVYQAVWEGPGPWAVTVNSGSVRVNLQPLESATLQVLGTREAVAMDPDPVDQDWKPGLFWQAKEALAAAKGEPNRLPTVREALESMRLAEALYAD